MAEIGIVGLGVMGGNLALNFSEKGVPVALFDRTPAKTDALVARAGPLAAKLTPCRTMHDLAAAQPRPRSVILLVPAGSPVDQVAGAVAAVMSPGDAIIDCGNSNFRDTRRRTEEFARQGIDFLGVGISGGEEGARHGPSVMAGGSASAWRRVAPIFAAAAARYEGEPCAALLGQDGAGHFVKTIHNGIEYADMEMIAEVYGVMRDGLGMTPDAMAEVFARWNGGRLKSYLVEIAATVLATRDPETGKSLVDVIRDTAGQKGTGKWATLEAAELGVPATTIEAAVTARLVAADRAGREATASAFAGMDQPKLRRQGDRRAMIDDLEKALLAGSIVAFAQGFAVMAAASREWKWDLPLGTVAKIWRAGCIIRSAFLDDIARAYVEGLGDGSMLLAEPFRTMLVEYVPSLRRIVSSAVENGLPVPALAAALGHFDMARAERSTADLIQAQRDFFGAHGFERTDRPGGPFHGPWHSG